MSPQEFRRGDNTRSAQCGRHTRGWRGPSRTSSTPRQQPRANEVLGPRIDSFNVKTLLIEEESPEIEDVKYVASYNWVNNNSPSILIPGRSLFPRLSLAPQ